MVISPTTRRMGDLYAKSVSVFLMCRDYYCFQSSEVGSIYVGRIGVMGAERCCCGTLPNIGIELE